jgi:tripartite-type tricarboxylate transporter receptor subunit TctC
MRANSVEAAVTAALIAMPISIAAQTIPAEPPLKGVYPAKPVRILVGFAPGGGTDIMARTIAAKLSESLKQQFFVDNRPGANANVAAKLAAEAHADGYTLLFMSVAHIMSKPVYRNLGYDIERDLAPITIVSSVPNVLCVNPALPARSVKDIIALAKSKPGELTYAT